MKKLLAIALFVCGVAAVGCSPASSAASSGSKAPASAAAK